ncbi:hypothetical protein JOB18_005824 [Solea senegalensis]|uniref:Plectin-like n=1 Tax=Solea senegalensis TaxID=28829 RepID=A0AAV6R5R9_SOLSE|nr:hypothetical protein JOB18_005824 [Solea senegalensis]
MDVLAAWAATNPAVARLLWVLVLVLATLLVWLFFFCCYSWNQSSSPSLEKYLAVMVKQSKTKAPAQRKKKSKEKPAAAALVVAAASAPLEEEVAIVKESSVTFGHETLCPSVRKRKRRARKGGMETVSGEKTQKVRSISPPSVTTGHRVSWCLS